MSPSLGRLVADRNPREPVSLLSPQIYRYLVVRGKAECKYLQVSNTGKYTQLAFRWRVPVRVVSTGITVMAA